MRVVLLHALPLSGAMWAEQLAWLPSSTLAPTLYDHGDSVAEWAASVLSEAGTDDLIVVGASVGGFCALEMARLAPHQVRAVVLVGSKAGIRRDDAQRAAALEVLRAKGLEHAWHEQWVPIFGPDTGTEVIERAQAMASAVGLDAIRRGVRAFFDRDDLSEFARTWPRPIHVVSGEHDLSPSVETGQSVAAAAVDGHFHLVARAGHYVTLEQPAAFDAILRSVAAT